MQHQSATCLLPGPSGNLVELSPAFKPTNVSDPPPNDLHVVVVGLAVAIFRGITSHEENDSFLHKLPQQSEQSLPLLQMFYFVHWMLSVFISEVADPRISKSCPELSTYVLNSSTPPPAQVSSLSCFPGSIGRSACEIYRSSSSSCFFSWCRESYHPASQIRTSWLESKNDCD